MLLPEIFLLVPTVHLLMVWLRSSGLISLPDISETGDARWVRWSIDALPVMWGWMMWPRWETVSCGGDLDLSHYFPYPSDPIFPKVPSHYFPYPFWSHISQSALLNTYALWFSAGGRCSLLSMGWVSLSSKEMPLTCSASCFRQSVGCGWVHNPQSFPLSGD